MLLVRTRLGSVVSGLRRAAGCFSVTGGLATAAEVFRIAVSMPLGSPVAWPRPGTAPTTVGGSSTMSAIAGGKPEGRVKRIGVTGAWDARGFTTTSVGGGTGAGGVSSTSKACGFGRTSGQIIGTSAMKATHAASPASPSPVVHARRPELALDNIVCSNIVTLLAQTHFGCGAGCQPADWGRPLGL